MKTVSVIGGNAIAGVMVNGPGPGISNRIVFAPLLAWLSLFMMASRKLPGPPSLVFTTVKVTGERELPAAKHGENSDVLPRASVAVAVMFRPNTVTGNVTEKLALPPASVVTVIEPRYKRPSPLPEASHWPLEKKSRSNAAFARLFNVPAMKVFPAEANALVMIGKF